MSNLRLPKPRKRTLLTAFLLISLFCILAGCGKQDSSTSSAEQPASAVPASDAITADSAPSSADEPVSRANIGTELVGEAASPLAVYDELLFDYGYAYSGAAVATAVTVAEIDNNILYADTADNDSGWHSLAFEFEDASVISSLKVNDSAVIIGTVQEPALAGDMVTLTGCSLYASGADTEPLAAAYQDCCDSQIRYAEAVISTADSTAPSDADADAYISSCTAVDYGALSENSDSTGKKVRLTAQILQITDSWQDLVVLRASDPEYSDATWYITCHAPEQELNAGDTVSFYGTFNGCEAFADADGSCTDVYILQAAVLDFDNEPSAQADSAQETAAVSVPFTDIDESSPYYDAVMWALQDGIVSGSSSGTFNPDDPCTREQLVTFLWRLAGEPAPQSTESPFTDVADPSSPYYNAILWSYETGIVSGSSENVFSGSESITRAQAIVMIWRLADSPAAESETVPFDDLDPSAYYYAAAVWAYDYGLCSADSGLFEPDAVCTRAEIIQFLYLFVNAV